MHIGELAHQTGLSTRQIRYWTQHGLISEHRDTNGYRIYDDISVARALRIHALLEAGLSMDQVGKIGDCLDYDQGVCDRECALLRAKRRQIEAKINCLRQAQQLIDNTLSQHDDAQ